MWVTKYRYPVLRGDVAERVRVLVRQTCDAFEIRIVRGVVNKDHVHILVSAPPTLAPSEIMRRIKDVRRVICLRTSRTSKSGIGGGISGRGAISAPRWGR